VSDFIVRFEGVKLSREQQHHVQAAIGAAVESALSHASFTPNPDDSGGGGGGGSVVFIPRRWNGRWIIAEAALKDNPGLLNSPLTVNVGGQTRGG
jgi:hypothetical protein